MNIAASAASAASAVLALHAAATPAQAASPDEQELAMAYGSRQSVAITTGEQLPIRRAPSVATVITAEDIAALGAADLDEVLETVAGLHVSRSFNFNNPLYLVRGIYGPQNPHVLLLEDGLPMTNAQQGNRGGVWGGYPLENVARIEIIRGPGSALYGADAYAGVINIITRAAGAPGPGRAGARIGSFGSVDAWLRQGGSIGPVDMAGYLRVGSTDGHQRLVAADAQTRNDRAFGTTASRAPGPLQLDREAFDAALRLAAGRWALRAGLQQRNHVGTGLGIGSALDPEGQGRTQRATAELSWHHGELAPHWGAGFNASARRHVTQFPGGLRIYPAGTRFPTGSFPEGMTGSPETWQRQFRVSAFAAYAGFSGHRLRLGAGHDVLDIYKVRERKNFGFTPSGLPVPLAAPVDLRGADAFLPPHLRRVTHLHLQDEWSMARDWSVTAGVRRDWISDVGATTNPRLAVLWDARHDLTLKLLYGTAFRAPGFAELYSISNPVNRGNPGLRPERIRTLEAAAVWQFARDAELNVNLFRHTMSDQIVPVLNPVAGTGSTIYNVGGQKGRGFELEMASEHGARLRLSGHFSYQRTIDRATRRDAGYAPRKDLHLRADWRAADQLLVTPQLQWIADRRRPAGDARPPVADYRLVHLTLRSPPRTRGWEWSLSIRNLFDADAREPSLAPGLQVPGDIPLEPRSVRVTSTWAF